jgi:hypothetical protein
MMSVDDEDSAAALKWLKDLVCVNIPSDKINAAAFGALGENAQTLDDDTRKLYEALRKQSPPVPHNEAFALSFAIRAIILDRIAEIRESAA